MSQVLTIVANPRSNSFTRRLLQSFLSAYSRRHPAAVITELDVYQCDIPVIDDAVIKAWDKPLQNRSSADLAVLSRVDRFTDQFIAADKIVIAAPMWNLHFPPQLLAYLATVMVAGKTFVYTEQGCQGLLRNKPVMLLHVRGGIFSAGPLQSMDFATPHLRSLCGMIGLTDFRSVICEGIEQAPDQAEKLLQQAMRQAEQQAETF
jgi:FMN-dependent NADH-azoreductase